MFATLVGPYPGATESEALEELTAAGLEPVSDGRGALDVSTDPSAAERLVDEWRQAAQGAAVAVKLALLGPYSAARRSGLEPLSAAEAVAEAVNRLAAAGCPFVEIEEPDAVAAAAAGALEVQRLAEALRRFGSALESQVHLSLVLTGGNVDGIGAAILFELPFASYAFDLIAGPDNWRLIAEAPADRGIVCGVLDPSDAADDRPEPLVWAAQYAASTRGRGLGRVGIANASSLVAAGLDRTRARRKVEALAEAARLASLEDPRELASKLDPRAVDSRSAALGRYESRDRT
ncbi:MAG: hypothetical protein ACJ77F_08700 [Chloroflexota bacterium]